MGKYRLDTPKGAIQFVFDQHGVAAARRKAVDLKVENKIERWINEWSGKKVPSPKGGGEKKSDGRRRVRELGHPKERRGTVVDEGPQVSKVQWDTGEVRYVSNKHLVTQVKKGMRDADDNE